MANSLLSMSVQTSTGRHALEVTATLLSLGTNKLVTGGARWLKHNGLMQYVLPVLLLNEAFGAYRVYLAGRAMGFW